MCFSAYLFMYLLRWSNCSNIFDHYFNWVSSLLVTELNHKSSLYSWKDHFDWIYVFQTFSPHLRQTTCAVTLCLPAASFTRSHSHPSTRKLWSYSSTRCSGLLSGTTEHGFSCLSSCGFCFCLIYKKRWWNTGDFVLLNHGKRKALLGLPSCLPYFSWASVKLLERPGEWVRTFLGLDFRESHSSLNFISKIC